MTVTKLENEHRVPRTPARGAVLWCVLLIGNAACSKDGGPAQASCDMRGSTDPGGSRICLDFHTEPNAAQRRICSAERGYALSNTPCDRTGALGGCRETGTTRWHYPSSRETTADDVRRGCSGEFVLLTVQPSEQAPPVAQAPAPPLEVREGTWALTMPPGWTAVPPPPGREARIFTNLDVDGEAYVKVNSFDDAPEIADAQLLAAAALQQHRERGHTIAPGGGRIEQNVVWYALEYVTQRDGRSEHWIYRVTQVGRLFLSVECAYPEGNADQRAKCESVFASARQVQ